MTEEERLELFLIRLVQALFTLLEPPEPPVPLPESANQKEENTDDQREHRQ